MKRKKTAARPRLDTRVEKSKAAVLRATYELLTQSGLSGVSVDEVSRRSGVAKTTIYRHWPSRESLLVDACALLSARPQAPDMGSARRDLEQLASHVTMRLREPWATVMPSIIDAAERDKQLAALQSSIHSQMREAFITVIERGQQKGEISKTQDARELVAAILGPIMYRRFFSREPLDEAFARRVLDRALTTRG